MPKTVFPAPNRKAFTKTLLVMKLTICLLIACCLGASASGISQTITLTGKDLPLETIFTRVKEQTGYVVFYNQALLKNTKPVSLSVRDMPLNRFFDLVLKDQSLSFRTEDKTIVLYRKAASPEVFQAVKLITPQEVVTGTVRSNDGTVLPGATVSVKGTRTSVTTDNKGSFSIPATATDTIVIAFVGFKTTEIALTAADLKRALVAELVRTGSDLDQVVVIGYGKVRKRDLTGAVSSVKAEDIALSPVQNPMEALQGRVSGLDIQRESGRAGSSPAVLLRGNRSLTASQNPLYIIDGIPTNINNLNPNDIESIDVLKDASSTAIYGSQGANGVIMITTKKAKAGKVQIDLNSYYGVNGFASFPKPLQGEAWLQYHRDRFFIENGVQPTALTDLGFTPAGIAAIEKGQWVDWVGEVLQTGSQQNHHLSFRGGSEKMQAYLSLGFIREKGIYQNDLSEVYNSRGGIELKAGNLLKTGFQSIVNYRKSTGTNSRVNKAYSVYPVGIPYDEAGNVNLRPIEGDPNVISLMANNYPGAYANQGRNFNLQFNPYVEFTPVKNVTLRSNFGAGLSSGRTGTFQGINSYNFLTEGKTDAEGNYETSMGYSYIWENFLTWKFNAGFDHEFTVTGLTSWANSKSEGTNIGGRGIDYEEFQFYNMSAYRTLYGISNSFSETSRMSFGGRINYAYKGKYLLQVTNRRDGASQLAEGNKWSSFPSASVAWRIIDEPFMLNTRSWLNDLKLRAGHGVSGLASIDPYSSLTGMTTRTSTANLSLGGGSVLPVYAPTAKIANADLTWERSANTNIGLEAAAFNNNITFTAEYYRTRTTGILWERRIPTSSGGADAKNPYEKMSNIGTSENRGWEFTIGSKNIHKKDFQWNTFATFTTAREQLVNIDLGKLTVDELVSEGLFMGQPVKDVYYGYKKTGVWQLGQEEEAAKYGAKPGDIKIATVEQVNANGEGDKGVHVYSTKDRMVVGNKIPDWFVGVQNTFRYKGFDLTVFINARYGQMLNAQVLGYWGTVAQPETYSTWRPDNPTNDFPRAGSTFSRTFESALMLVDGSYIKIKNVTLGYTLRENAGKRLGIGNLRVYGTAYNPLIFTRSHLLKNVDPENGGADSFPLFKQIVFGINLSL
ncbi:SusC/RagA family TonB-linked outer membrane protein [Filimonas zeae]|uniref:SusC/RagA family TonB-linked outer membrane protein n=2 Tax=Filimonas zeae TaxID=1737353 RepID=A0A917ILG4_9BACT|nr:SusC/RagA family TonB-linked outer membrane protein [Filimonas zeae]